jgi:hypothetical protein
MTGVEPNLLINIQLNKWVTRCQNIIESQMTGVETNVYISL